MILADSYRQQLSIAEIEVEEYKKTHLRLENAIDELQLIAEGKTESHDKYIQDLQDILHQKEAVIAGKNRLIQEKNRRFESFRIPFLIHVDPRGNCWHRDENSGHVRSSTTRALHGCELCGAELEMTNSQ
jgi:hypothetical protein